jgi:ATP-dependent Zn protease
MAATAEPLTGGRASTELQRELSSQWRRLGRAATFVAVVTSPAVFVWLYSVKDLPLRWAIILTFLAVVSFRGLMDVIMRRAVPWPSLFGTDDARHREEDVVNRRRAWFWRSWTRLGVLLVVGVTTVFLVKLLATGSASWLAIFHSFTHALPKLWSGIKQSGPILFLFPIYFLFNFLILLGPMLMMGISQMRGYEPGDAEWGVKLDDVRGQAEAKEEVRRVVNLWQSGEAFEQAGGKRERGLLFLGSPGTGKTMLAKAIATGFNSPFVSIPGSGFAQTFIGIDAIIVRFLARKAKRLARKWGGQCIIFIDEIDAVGMRRNALQGGGMAGAMSPQSIHDIGFYGPFGAVNPSGDVIIESRRWREKMFEQRAPERHSPYPPIVHKIGSLLGQFPGGMMGGMGGGLALNQLLVTMDGIDNPPFTRRVVTSRINTILDAIYIVPRRIGKVSLRLPPPRPRKEQIYFIGATNVDINVLDPALIRPGRMGRHVWFRTPTKDDRKDIFDLYLAKVAHDPDLDTPKRRDEIARITNGYSPAMIEQICSMALTHAHHEASEAFGWDHLVEAMTTVESGTAVGVKYIPDETRAVAIHEAGHAAAAHAYKPGLESSRISIKMRGGSLGHHQAFEKEERFSAWRSENMGTLVHILGAMAAEYVFYGENSNGVGGDLNSVTNLAASMVGASGMTPTRIDLKGATFADETEEETRKRLMKRFEEIGLNVMNRTRGGADFHADPIASVLNDPHKKMQAAQIIGQAYVIAENFISANRDAVEQIANTVIAKGEIYGDELLELLDSANLVKPEIDYLKEETWPRI